jgi:hypothetical protein
MHTFAITQTVYTPSTITLEMPNYPFIITAICPFLCFTGGRKALKLQVDAKITR